MSTKDLIIRDLLLLSLFGLVGVSYLYYDKNIREHTIEAKVKLDNRTLKEKLRAIGYNIK